MLEIDMTAPILTLVALFVGLLVGGLAMLAHRRFSDREPRLIQQAFERGLRAGAEEEKARWEVRIEPYHSHETSFLGARKTVQVGYKRQIFYGGLPVMEPQLVVEDTKTEWDERLVQQFLDMAGEAAKVALVELARGGVRAVLAKGR